MEDERDVLVCAPFDAARAVYPSSVEGQCNDCGTKVWVAPSGQKLIREKAVRIICIECALNRIKNSSTPPEIKIAPGAINEINAWQKRN